MPPARVAGDIAVNRVIARLRACFNRALARVLLRAGSRLMESGRFYLHDVKRFLDHADISTTSRYLQASRLTGVAKRWQIAVIARCEQWPISG